MMRRRAAMLLVVAVLVAAAAVALNDHRPIAYDQGPVAGLSEVVERGLGFQSDARTNDGDGTIDDGPCGADVSLPADASGRQVQCVLERLSERGHAVDASATRFDQRGLAALQRFASNNELPWKDAATPLILEQLGLWAGGPLHEDCTVDDPVAPDEESPDVRCVVQRLAQLGYAVNSPAERLDSDSDAALRAFQGDNGLTVDGIAGPATLTRLQLWPGSTGPMVVEKGRVNTVGDGQVALTFDDGLSPYSEPILDILAETGVTATFFVVGQSVANNEAMLRRLLEDGHSLQNHTWNHPNLTRSSWSTIHSQLEDTSNAIEAATGHRPTCYRPPEGATDGNVRTVASGLGLYPEIMWNVNPHDYRDGISPAAVLSSSLEQADGRGLIIGLHDGGGNQSSTVEALPQIIAGLRDRGYEFVTLCN